MFCVFQNLKFGATTGLDLPCHKEMAYVFHSGVEVPDTPIFTGNLPV